MTVCNQTTRNRWSWRCLHCHDALIWGAASLDCPGCGRNYPVVAGIPILVREPVHYLRSEIESLARTERDAEKRREWLDQIEATGGLPKASVDRHRDVIATEIARAETFLDLLRPGAQALAGAPPEKLAVRRSGWALDPLLGYMLRDWTDTPEFAALATTFCAALRSFVSDLSGKSVVIAGCGAGGLLAALPAECERVLGFDLTLPVLVAARHLLDGNSIDLPLPRAVNQAGRMLLRRREDEATGPPAELVAMDAFDTAFTDGSVHCVITAFLIDLFPEPRRLASEIRRILAKDGVWINYGPSGPLTAFQRFDTAETAAFFEAAGFAVIGAETYRTTYLDLSRDCSAWSFQNHLCYLTAGRKAGDAEGAAVATSPMMVELAKIIPEHLPGATLIRRQPLGGQPSHSTILRHEGVPGRSASFGVSDDMVRILTLVDGKRTVGDIADLLHREAPPLQTDQVIDAFAEYLRQGVLSWRSQSDAG